MLLWGVMVLNKGKLFLTANILVPLVIGALIYYFVSPDVIFVKKLDSWLGRGLRVAISSCDFWFVKFLRNYFLDMLWGYALTFGLFFVIGNNTAELTKILVIALVFSAMTEVLQLTPVVSGTFDLLDIFAEFLAELTAVLIIKYVGGTKEL